MRSSGEARIGEGPHGLIVECHAGYRGEETPVRFRLGDQVIEVASVLDRWLAPDHRYFKVQAADAIYILRNDVSNHEWELTLFERRPSAERS